MKIGLRFWWVAATLAFTVAGIVFASHLGGMSQKQLAHPPAWFYVVSPVIGLGFFGGWIGTLGIGLYSLGTRGARKQKDKAAQRTADLNAAQSRPIVPQKAPVGGEAVYYQTQAEGFAAGVAHSRQRYGVSVPLHVAGIRAFASTSPKDRTVWASQGVGTLTFSNNRILFTTAMQNVTIPYNKIVNVSVADDGIIISRENSSSFAFKTGSLEAGVTLDRILKGDTQGRPSSDGLAVQPT
jgi:hypothetical protein